MYKVKIYGAGSIGNHLAHAARRLGWTVDICDVDPQALRRTREDIYPARYGSWDDSLSLYVVGEEPRGDYDLIIVGTPPDHHIAVAQKAVEERPRAILIEKPICTPGLDGAQALADGLAAADIRGFVGYDHVVGRAAQRVGEIAAGRRLGKIETLDVEFREYWGGIFAAHPWLDGPADTYLGYWSRGGGALGEHSHAVNLWQFLARAAGAGRICEVGAAVEYVTSGGADYDKIGLVNVRTDQGLVGRIVQDVVTQPARKWGRVQGNDGFVEFQFGYQPNQDRVTWKTGDVDPATEIFEKTRPDDFVAELSHIQAALEGDIRESPIDISHGLDTMLVIAAAYQAARTRSVIEIDYKQGYSPAALRTL